MASTSEVNKVNSGDIDSIYNYAKSVEDAEFNSRMIKELNAYNREVKTYWILTAIAVATLSITIIALPVCIANYYPITGLLAVGTLGLMTYFIVSDLNDARKKEKAFRASFDAKSWSSREINMIKQEINYVKNRIVQTNSENKYRSLNAKKEQLELELAAAKQLKNQLFPDQSRK